MVNYLIEDAATAEVESAGRLGGDLEKNGGRQQQTLNEKVLASSHVEVKNCLFKAKVVF